MVNTEPPTASSMPSMIARVSGIFRVKVVP